jgi:hypothetical protein
MTDNERIEAVLKSVEWWDADLLVMAARGWYSDWRGKMKHFTPSQWGAARRVGAGLESYTQFCEAWQEFLFGKKGPDGEGHGGAADRDKKHRNWGQPRLAEDFLMAISGASEAQESERARKFDARASLLGSRAAERLQDWRRLRQARQFLDFLVMTTRADLDPKEKA